MGEASTAPKNHRLAMVLTTEGYIVAEVICPFEDTVSHDASCAMVNEAGDPVDGCYVGAKFDEIGMECFVGEVVLPTIDITWEGTDFDSFKIASISAPTPVDRTSLREETMRELVRFHQTNDPRPFLVAQKRYNDEEAALRRALYELTGEHYGPTERSTTGTKTP